jgi:poly(hydroxyalkanoate) depolymerase family esterase
VVRPLFMNRRLSIGSALLGTACLFGTACDASEPIGGAESALGSGTFEAVAGFSPNPGAIEMFRYVPPTVPAGPRPLVMALHGCTVDANAFRNVGWEKLADEYGFYLIYPSQSTANNPVRCFNWGGEYGDPANLVRGMGENRSLIAMIERMKTDFSIDDDRVFVMGHSAGAAETALLMATWPEVFRAAGIIAGIPYRCATTVADSFSCMSAGSDRTPDLWAELVRDAAPVPARGYPRLSVWHGTTDGVVSPVNQRELLDQWTAVHGIDATADRTETIDGYPRRTFEDAAGEALIESWEITGQGHATFIDPDNDCGTTGAYITDAHVCSVARMAEFFGIASVTGPSDEDAGTPSGRDSGASDRDAGRSVGRDGGATDPAMEAPSSMSGCCECSVGRTAEPPIFGCLLVMLAFAWRWRRR